MRQRCGGRSCRCTATRRPDVRLQQLLGSSLGKMDGAPPERCSLDRRRQRDAELFCQARTAAAAVILYGWGWSPCSPPPDWSVWPTWKHAAARKARKLVKTASWWGWRITATTCSRTCVDILGLCVEQRRPPSKQRLDWTQCRDWASLPVSGGRFTQLLECANDCI